MDALDVAALKRIERLEKVVLTGNGTPSIVSALTAAVTRLDSFGEDIKDTKDLISEIKKIDSQRLEKKVDFERAISRKMMVGIALIIASSIANFFLG